MNRTSCKTHGMYDDRSDGCPVCRIEELEAQLAANKETVRLLIDRWNGEAGEWLGSDDCAYELQQALENES